MTPNRLTICYNAWMMFSESTDYHKSILEVKERGFNCIRLEDFAGMLWDADGNERRDLKIHAPFGHYTKYTTYKTLMISGTINPLERLLAFCRAAQELEMKIIPSSWFFLHTNWFLEEEDSQPLFDLSTEEKISFFADELDRILCLLKKEGLIDIVAFAEIFNEFDGLPFAGEYKPVSEEEALILRALHEAALDKLKKKHPDILFAYDSWKPNMQESMIPRNIDVLNFHYYYARSIYRHFENGCIGWSMEDRIVPPETEYFLIKNRPTIKDTIEAMGGVPKTGRDWPSILCLYTAIDPAKQDELGSMLEGHFEEEFEAYKNHIHHGLKLAADIRDRVAPGAKLVMGEGATYCPSPNLPFECNSKIAWKLFEEHIRYAVQLNFWGTIIRTNARQGDATWTTNKEDYLRLNGLFLDS